MSGRLAAGSRRIEVTIAPDGSVKIEAHGYTGNECLAATKSLEEALGAAGDRTRKPEIYATTAGVGVQTKR